MARFDFMWGPYVPVAQRRANAQAEAKKRLKRGEKLEPVVIEGRKIATSFWGVSWCENLEKYADFASRLPRGRSYARNGSVIDLKVTKGAVRALVSGSELYETKVDVTPLAPKAWRKLVDGHASHVSSIVDLLQGRL